MDDPLYKELILEHWQNPQNHGIIDPADFDVSDNNPLCGDEIRLTGKFKGSKLVNIAFSGQGCAISQASASLYTEAIKGLSKPEIRKFSAQKVLDEFGIELTPARTKCALLVYQTMKSVIQ